MIAIRLSTRSWRAATYAAAAQYAVSSLIAAWSSSGSMISSLVSEDERAALWKTTILRKQCGYRSPSGGLIDYHVRLDAGRDEKGFDVQLMRWWIECANHIIETLKKIKRQKPEFQIEKYLKDGSINYDLLICDLNQGSSSRSTSMALGFSQPELPKLIEEFKKLRAAIDDLHQDLNESVYVNTYCFVDGPRNWRMAPFPFTSESVKNLVNQESVDEETGSTLKWIEYIKREQMVFQNLQFNINGVTDVSRRNRMDEIKYLLMRSNPLPSAAEILGLSADSYTREEVADLYRADSRLLHPDKLPLENKNVGAYFFGVVTTAKNELLELLE